MLGVEAVLQSLRAKLGRLSLAQRFLLSSLIVLGLGMVGLGLFTGRQIEEGVVHQTGATTALYVESFVSPNLQELQSTDSISQEHLEALGRLLEDTPLGKQIVAFKVWGANGRVIYSTESSAIGQVYPMHEGLRIATGGQVSSKISELTEDENAPERGRYRRLLETYAPVHLQGSSQVIAVAEFYQTVDDLEKEVAAAQQRSWLVVAAAATLMYLALAVFVRRASDTITRQEKQNQALDERVRRAAARTTALNESWLRRISAELHDGPIQDLTQALLELDWLAENSESDASGASAKANGNKNLDSIRGSIRYTLQELRTISGGLVLPQLRELTLEDLVRRVIRAHEQRTGTSVHLDLARLPTNASLPVKITVYRVIQEALTNAFRHAGGVDQVVSMSGDGDHLNIQISDGGPGFQGMSPTDDGKHLGLIGMRERVESLGGEFKVQSRPGEGTRIIARLPLQAVNRYE